MEITVTKLVETFLKNNKDTELNINYKDYNSEKTILEILEEKLNNFQFEEIITKIGFAPKFDKNNIKASIQAIDFWQKEYERLKKQGIGKEKLIEVLPDYEYIEKIISNIEKLYHKNPKEAGEYAEKYIGYNPFNNFMNIKGRKLKEPNEIVKICDNIIKYSFDLLDYDTLYEFKLTKKTNLPNTLKKSLIQSYIYDFCYRYKNKINYHRNIIIEIYLIDLKKILRFGTISMIPGQKEIKVNKTVLKEVFKSNELNNLTEMNHLIDKIYDHIKPRFEDDFEYDINIIDKR